MWQGYRKGTGQGTGYVTLSETACQTKASLKNYTSAQIVVKKHSLGSEFVWLGTGANVGLF